MSNCNYTFLLVDWNKSNKEILSIQERILDFKNADTLHPEIVKKSPEAMHVVAYSDSKPVGTGCILPQGQIPYVGVVREMRYHDLGHAILAYLLHIAKVKRYDMVWVNSPVDTVVFFEKKGFTKTDESFEIDGEKYWKMVQLIAEKEKLPVH